MSDWTFSITVGPWGGVWAKRIRNHWPYLYRIGLKWRLNIGWIAFTVMKGDLPKLARNIMGGKDE